jgi:hypothetical protein
MLPQPATITRNIGRLVQPGAASLLGVSSSAAARAARKCRNSVALASDLSDIGRSPTPFLTQIYTLPHESDTPLAVSRPLLTLAVYSAGSVVAALSSIIARHFRPVEEPSGGDASRAGSCHRRRQAVK